MQKKFNVLISEEAKKFIKSLDIKLQKKVTYNIQKAREVNDPKIFKKLNDGLWEFKTRFDKVQVRLLAFWDPEIKSLVICSNGFIKKTKKTPKKEIDRAKEFRKEYLKNKK